MDQYFYTKNKNINWSKLCLNFSMGFSKLNIDSF